MATLPAITVTDAQLARLVAAFPGTTNAEKAEAYRKFVTGKLIDFVLEAEIRQLEDEMSTERHAMEEVLTTRRREREQLIMESLPPRP